MSNTQELEVSSPRYDESVFHAENYILPLGTLMEDSGDIDGDHWVIVNGHFTEHEDVMYQIKNPLHRLYKAMHGQVPASAIHPDVRPMILQLINDGVLLVFSQDSSKPIPNVIPVIWDGFEAVERRADGYSVRNNQSGTTVFFAGWKPVFLDLVDNKRTLDEIRNEVKEMTESGTDESATLLAELGHLEVSVDDFLHLTLVSFVRSLVMLGATTLEPAGEWFGNGARI